MRSFSSILYPKGKKNDLFQIKSGKLFVAGILLLSFESIAGFCLRLFSSLSLSLFTFVCRPECIDEICPLLGIVCCLP